ncbi:MAG TPA: DUF11 domain-containing protein [Anaerolineales bacterium]|nr:DUF11 domain-containing protein [Anaerolineales bacterium]
MKRKWLLLSVVILGALGMVTAMLVAAGTQAALAAETETSHVSESPTMGSPTTRILLVDDDDNIPDVYPYYSLILSSLGYTYTVWDTDVSDVEPSASYLQNFDAVIWFTGDAFGGTSGPGPQSEAELQIWLDNNAACLLISSQDYFYDRGLTPFMTNYLGVEGAAQDVAQAVVTGTHSYGGLGPFSLSYPISMSNYSDAFTLTALAEESFMGDKSTYLGGGGGFVDANGRWVPSGVLTATLDPSFAAGSSLKNQAFGWQTTWLGFPLEAIPNYFDQVRTMHRFLSNCFATDLRTIITPSSPVIHLNELLTYTIQVVNNGPYTSTNITFQDFIPNTFVVQNFSPFKTCDTVGGGNVNCSISQLPPGTAELITITVSPTLPGGFTNFGFSTNFSQDLSPENNSTSAFVRVLDPADTTLYLDKVVPAVVNRDTGGTVEVFGANFQPGLQLFLDTVPVTFVPNASHPDAVLNVTIPADFDKGVYSIIAQNPTGDPAMLFKALVVYDPNALRVDEVLPQMGANDRPVTLNIFGDGFVPGLTGVLIDSANQQIFYPLEMPSFVSENLVRAAVPYGLPAGTYDVRLTNPVGISDTLDASYVSLDWFEADDVGAFAFDFYTIPAAPREGQTVTVGLTVRRRTGEGAPFVSGQVGLNVNLGISGGGATPDLVLGTTGIISPNTTVSMTLPWTPALAGAYHLTIDVTSPELLTDTIPINNHLERQVTVLPASTDPDPPVISELSVNGGALITAIPAVVLDTTASDVGSGLAFIYYIDYRFDRDLGDWYPAQETGWLPYDTASTGFEWTLDPSPGAHYVQAWVSDMDGNVSLPKVALINLIAPKNQINHDGGQVYRLPLFPVTSLQINLTSLTGDADMYAWAPDGSLAASSYSGNPFEEIVLVGGINPPGIYQIDVFGFEATSYWFEVTLSGAGEMTETTLSPDDVQGHVKGGDRPLQVVENNPGGDVNVPPPPGAERVYLPIIVR